MTGGKEFITQATEKEANDKIVIDEQEAKNIADGLKKGYEKEEYKQVLEKKEHMNNMANGILEFFDGDNAMKILTLDDGSKEAYEDIINFLLMLNQKKNNSLLEGKIVNNLTKIRDDLNPLKYNMTTYSWLLLQVREKEKGTENLKNPGLFDNIFEYSKTNDDPVLETTFNVGLRERRLQELNSKLDEKSEKYDANIYTNFTKASINQLYKNQLNDSGLMNHLLTYTPDKGSKSEIKKYIAELTNSIKVKNIYNGKYAEVNLPKLPSIVDDVKEMEISYKKEQLNIVMKSVVDAQLARYTSLSENKEELIKNLYEQVEDIIDGYEDSEVMSNYKKRDAEKSSFKKEINLVLNEVVAEQNREYIAERFKTLKSVNYIDKSDKQEKTVEYSEKEQAHFESMLKETKDNDVNNLALAIDYPDMNDPEGNSIILKGLWKKIKERGDDDKSIAFFGAKIHSATNIEEIQAIEQNTDTNSKYTAQLEATKKTNSIESSTETMFSVLDTYLKNADVKSLTVNVPKGNNVLLNQVKEVIQRAAEANPNGVAIDIAEVDNAKEVKIVSREKTETPGNIKLDMKKLNANVIGDATKINELLAGADPTMKAILEDPNYKITGGNVFGSASRNRTTREKKFADLGTNVNVKDGMPVNEPKNDALTNNPGLAYDRAASFIDYFMGLQDKVSASAKFDLTYGVNGPTRKELTAQLTEKNGGKTPTESQILEAFKEWQYATIDLDFLKTEEKTNETVIPVEELQAATGFQIYIKAEPVKTASNRPPRIRIPSGGGGYHPPRRARAIPCPSFGCYAYH